jgi:DNA-binding IclR family transcriptional regulator
VAFAAEYVASRDELYALVLLVRHHEQWWDVTTLAEHIGLSVPSTRLILDRFVALSLLDVRIADDLRYRFSPGPVGLREATEAFVDTFQRSPALVMQLLRPSRRRSLEDFSDAFRIRRNDDR